MIETTEEPTGLETRIADLAQRIGTTLHLPGTPGYDGGRFAWNTAVDQRPAAVATPDTVEELARVVRAVREHGLRLTVQATGHSAAVLAQHRLDDVVLVRTNALRGVHVDPATRVARVEAGACWQDVIDAAVPHGLTALHGSAPDVGVVGYTLGGGFSWLARKHGLAANSVVGVELVDADGEVVRADRHTRPELFWALRGGVAGNFGIVTTIEVSLLELPDVHAGMMMWDLEQAPEVLATFADWSATAPDEATAAWRAIRFPPLPELPDFLRGRSLVVLDAAVLLDDKAAGDLLAPLRALRPELDTFARVPAAALTGLHMDPPEPSPGVSDGLVLDRLDEAAVQGLLELVGPGADTSIMVAELRMLGGALGRPAPGGGVLDRVPGSHIAFFLCMAPVPEMVPGAESAVAGAVAAMSQWSGERRALNFSESAGGVSRAFAPEDWTRLQALKRQVDPDGIFLAHHAVE